MKKMTEKTKKITGVRASVCLILATALEITMQKFVKAWSHQASESPEKIQV